MTATPARARTRTAAAPAHRRSVLPSGLRVVTQAMPGSRSASVAIFVPVGSRHEDERNAGLSHLLEHLVFKGTRGYPEAGSLSQVVEGVGGNVNASTDRELTVYSAKVPAAHAILRRLADVGLGYLTLGQPLTTLSGGERQRLKLATHMGEKGGTYVLDEPTSGLHLADVEQLLGLLDRLVDSGKSVIVIEHHQAVMAHADWIIDLGPGAGHDGGKVVFEGTPAALVAKGSTLTGKHLAAFTGAPAKSART